VRFAAIDIGSNAVRLLITNVFEEDGKPVFIKDSLYRVPVRLGEEAFVKGEFSKEKVEDLTTAMTAFRLLMQVHCTLGYRAYATSAMREAVNGSAAVELIKEKAGLNVEIISGQKEASIILHSEFGSPSKDDKRAYLYIDVGGGSTELVFIRQGVVLASRSFLLGTLRLLSGKVAPRTWDEVKSWIEAHAPSSRANLTAIGSGGNINKLIKVYGRSRENFMSRDQIEGAYQHLNSMSYGERIRRIGLKPDRADVIVPAALIFMRVMHWAGIRKVMIPKFGISDGIIAEIYHEYRQKSGELIGPGGRAVG
jgi:exopolyphosphatase/guanosine-5'-triphosphate,3'-diphosphate pyrophosphatase